MIGMNEVFLLKWSWNQLLTIDMNKEVLDNNSSTLAEYSLKCPKAVKTAEV